MLREIVMPLVAVQPDCPLQFERVERLMNVDGGGANIYRLLNRGSKPIPSFTISIPVSEWKWRIVGMAQGRFSVGRTW